MPDVNITRIEQDISLEWAMHNPELLDRTIKDFFLQYQDDYVFSLKQTRGFITLIAHKDNQNVPFK